MNPLNYEDANTLLLKVLGDEFAIVIEKSPKKVKFKIMTTRDSRKIVLYKISEELKNLGHIFVYKKRSSLSKSTGHIQCGDIIFISKPLNGATENLHINASCLASGGHSEIIKNFCGAKNVPCYTFIKAEDLYVSVLESLANNKNVSPAIWFSVMDYFTHSKTLTRIEWNDSVFLTEKNELGKYLGELIIGAFALEDNLAAISPNFKDIKAKKFLVPKNSRHNCIDCAILTQDDVLIPISIKYGAGALASFFTNLLPKIMDQKKKVTKKMALYPLIRIVESMKIDQPEKKARDIIYEYGIRHALKLKSNVVIDCPSIYFDLLNGRSTRETQTIISTIKSKSLNPAIISRLNKDNGFSSVTGFFSRHLAESLESCPESMKLMVNIINNKNFWQASLNDTKWEKGIVEYNLLSSKKSKLKIIGSKTPLTDLTGKNGLINYKLYES